MVGDFLGRFSHWASPTLWTAPVLVAVVLVIGTQLLPPRPWEGLRIRLERLNPALLGAALALVIAFVGSTVPSNGVPPFIYFRF